MTWVSVKDGLPDTDRLAIVTDGRRVTLAEWTRAGRWVLDREDRALGISADALTHWMPLPTPPAQEQREA